MGVTVNALPPFSCQSEIVLLTFLNPAFDLPDASPGFIPALDGSLQEINA